MRKTPSTRIAASLVAACLVAAFPVLANTTEDRRLEACREVLEEFLGMQEGIPRSLIERAECVAVLPSVKKFALGFGGRFGKGAVSCRTEEGKGAWGPPLLISLG